ncbi:MAG: type II toxin-antitoxin system Phd/YefM family antitoxin [Oscillibacter sp.]|nr:type II toxin-antitoxin system Phd/YefM family antitoxin [Oscillibacter sp.]
MPQIIPIKDLKNTSEISDMCHKADEPIYITKNGYGDMVIMSMEIYENIMRQLTMYQDVERMATAIPLALDGGLR